MTVGASWQRQLRLPKSMHVPRDAVAEVRALSCERGLWGATHRRAGRVRIPREAGACPVHAARSSKRTPSVAPAPRGCASGRLRCAGGIACGAGPVGPAVRH
jgi:hypothetical protein